jgi:hypothetical protein
MVLDAPERPQHANRISIRRIDACLSYFGRRFYVCTARNAPLFTAVRFLLLSFVFGAVRNYIPPHLAAATVTISRGLGMCKHNGQTTSQSTTTTIEPE